MHFYREVLPDITVGYYNLRGGVAGTLSNERKFIYAFLGHTTSARFIIGGSVTIYYKDALVRGCIKYCLCGHESGRATANNHNIKFCSYVNPSGTLSIFS